MGLSISRSIVESAWRGRHACGGRTTSSLGRPRCPSLFLTELFDLPTTLPLLLTYPFLSSLPSLHLSYIHFPFFASVSLFLFFLPPASPLTFPAIANGENRAPLQECKSKNP